MHFKLLVLLIILFQLSFAKENQIVVAGPIATVSHPFFHMIKTNALNDVTNNLEFKLWKNPDELRSLILNNNVDIIAIPTNVAANLYNKNQDIKLLGVSIWGILGLISRDNNLKTLKDFKNKEIVVPFRQDMPDIVLTQLIKNQGMDIHKDFKIRYASSPIDAMQMLILRQVDHALLAEPAISIALRKTKSFPLKLVAPDLYRSVNLQEEWGKTFNTKEQVPQAGIAILGKLSKNKYLIKRFEQEYIKSLNWYKNNPKKASKLTVANLKMLEEKGLADSIKYVDIEYKKAIDSKDDIEEFFKILMQSNPKLIGSKLPDSNFYYKD
ncbi:ABC transporter substrate-binding protein [Malaciobacter halophilus]|uniref:ABC transporter substrate-binding protein n=1 Tax=Malaciobacter halophilus TaxID=197482 RepID=A0A2N1J424_9BACT|nr:ABC transporter substrate-binding protein [Malaciobacter halophilus]AXH10415.1 nitrate/sulfonate/bicarbonate ABC transporter, periplasmic substrate-binding protein [Malaciobacter halophilus]PKI81325.1 ABC transporter substrate-binding protein [Malaciobacter halophilus]